jgi:hypothetical protein
MTRLIPVTGVLGVVAEVEKADPDAADVLVQFGLFEALGDLVDAARPRLTRVVSKAMQARADDGRRALVRTYLDRRMNGEEVDDIIKAAASLTAVEFHVSKASDDDPDTDYWDARDERGRFVSRLRPSDSTPMAHNEAAANKLEDLKRAGALSAGSKVRVHGYGSDGRRKSGNTTVGEHHADTLANVEDEAAVPYPTHISVHPNDTNRPTGNRGLAFDAIAHATGNLGAAQRGTQQAPLAPNDFGRELDDATRRSSEGDRRAFRQINATGRALRAVSTPGSTTHVAGGVAQLVGELGPQAERVLGPGIRRTAYRYRGTERRPDAELVNEVSSATPIAAAISASDVDGIRQLADTQLSAPVAGDRSGGGRQRGGAGLAIGSATRLIGARGLSEDQVEMRMRGDTALGYLNRKVPTPERTALSIASGRVPPSQGVIIDRNGDVVTEAMGAGSDHYLPFDLKNLKALQGGQYARTRAAGGPTTEDIYTGLLGGARQIQVISNSGVFTVEFDPNLRGGRRYSDKARQMIGRYEALLSRVASGEEYAQDIPDSQRAEIKRQALERSGYNADVAGGIENQMLEEARLRGQFDGPSDEEIDEAAENQVRAEARSGKLSVNSNGALQRAIQDRARQIRSTQKDERVRRLQLDGEGYARALDSLKEEFPYFIRDAFYETRQDFVTSRRHIEPDEPLPSGSPRTPDKGYVRPGYRNVTAHDRNGSSQPAANSSQSGSTGSGGGERQRTPAQNGSGARSSGGKLPNPVGFRPEPANKLSELGGPELKNRLANSLDNISGLIDMPAANLPTDEDLKDPARAVAAPVTFVRTLAQKHGGLRGAADALANAPAEQITAFSRGLQAMSAEVDDLDRAGDSGYRERIPKEQVDEAIKTLGLLKTARAPYVDYKDDPALYSPENPRAAAPQRFDEIDALGDRLDNYEGFYRQAKGSGGNQGSAPDLAKEIDRLAQHRPEDRAQIVSQAVQQFKAMRQWGQGTATTPRPPGVPSGVEWRQARDLAAADINSPEYKQLHNMQAAWSYLHGKEAVGSLGGGAGPKAPEQGDSGTTRAVPPVTFQGAAPHPVRKRGPRRVVVHPPDSPVAKAFQRVQSRRASSTR